MNDSPPPFGSFGHGLGRAGNKESGRNIVFLETNLRKNLSTGKRDFRISRLISSEWVGRAPWEIDLGPFSVTNWN